MPTTSAILATDSILPAWIVLPTATVTMLVVASHLLAIQSSDMPARRRRIRTASGLFMLIVTALLAYALGMAQVVDRPTSDPAGTRQFVIVWVTIIGLLGMVVALASVDALHTVSSGLASRRRLRTQLRAGPADIITGRRAASVTASRRPKSPQSPSSQRRQDATRAG